MGGNVLIRDFVAGTARARSVALWTATALLVVLFLLHFWVDDPDEPVFLYTLPVLIVGIGRGVRDGVVAAGIAVALYVAWWLNKGMHVDALGIGSRAAALSLVAVVGGYMAAQLREQLEERRVLFEVAFDGIFQLDRRGCIIAGNRATVRLFGYSLAEFDGLDLGDLLGPKLDPHDSIDGPLIFSGRRKDGSEFAAEVSIGIGPQHDTVIVRDVSRRHRAEARLRHLLESGTDAIVLVGRGGAVELVNARAEELFGWRREALVGQPAEVLVPPEERSAVAERIGRYLKKPERQTVGGSSDYFVWRGDGTRVPVEISMSPFWADGGVRVTLSIRDVSERRRIQTQLASAMDQLHLRAVELERSNDALTDFAQLVSHDLGEPLMTASLHGELLESRLDDLDTEGRRTLAKLRATLDTMRRRIDAVLDYARVHRESIETREVDANVVVREAVDALEAVITGTGATVVIGTLPTVRADPHQLSQVFQNLISNATKFAAPDRSPRIAIDARDERYGWHFTVVDNGIGVPVDERGAVFGMFERSTSAGPYAGSGVGLALCKKIVELHGGRIWIESHGEGSTVNLTLPR